MKLKFGHLKIDYCNKFLKVCSYFSYQFSRVFPSGGTGGTSHHDFPPPSKPCPPKNSQKTIGKTIAIVLEQYPIVKNPPLVNLLWKTLFSYYKNYSNNWSISVTQCPQSKVCDNVDYCLTKISIRPKRSISCVFSLFIVPSLFFVHFPYKGRINRAESVLTGLKPY